MSSSNWVDNSGYTHLELYPNGSYKSFVPTVETDWMLGDVAIKLPADHIVEFYDNGQFKSFTLMDTIQVGVHGTRAWVEHDTLMTFHENGAAKSLTLASQKSGWFGSADWEYRGRKYPPGTDIEFSADGKIASAKLR